jgi:hypothetical protein
MREEFTFDRVLELVYSAQKGHGVSGTVTKTDTGEVVGQVKLLLERLTDEGVYVAVQEKQSANDGTYKFNGVVNGSYRIRASKPGFVTQEQSVEVQDGPEVVDFVLDEEA